MANSSRKRTLTDDFSYASAPEKSSKIAHASTGEGTSTSHPDTAVESDARKTQDGQNSQSDTLGCSGKATTECSKTTATREVRSFHGKWLDTFPWLSYSEESKTMTCMLCLKYKKTNTLTSGKCNNFKTSTLTRHADSSDHKSAVVADSMSGTLVKTVNKVYDQKEIAVMKAMKVVFWMCKEDISITKFNSLLSLLETLECPDLMNLKTGQSVTYSSDKSAKDFIESIATAVRNSVQENIDKSPFISILCDESTDIGVKKKLNVYARVVNLETFQPDTLYLCNKEVETATGKGIFDALVSMKEVKAIPKKKIMGLGTDGAKVMTGLGKGLTGYMTRENPMMLNYHCVAHRLALVTSQAADEVPYLKDYQSVLTGIFYFFKSSAKRTHELKEVQKMLDEPELKVKEVHEVRWMSVYLAVETIYKILDSLLTFFSQDKDAKSRGYIKKMIQYDFVASTYLLMDVLPVVTELCLLFQKKNLDVSLVKISIETCKKDLSKIRNDTGAHLQKLVNEDLKTEKGKVVYKENHVLQGKHNIDSIKRAFIDAILLKLDERFPQDDSNIIYAFGTLAMRPISFCSKTDLESWGNEQLETLIKQYGESKESEPTEDQPQIKCEPVINPENTRREWALVKPLVVQEGYPRDSMSTLWHLINSNYKEKFPNLINLAALALTSPIHTSDCERGFSEQNQIKTSLRNRISSETVDNLMMIKIQGGNLEDFDFRDALKLWREKQRKIFSKK